MGWVRRALDRWHAKPTAPTAPSSVDDDWKPGDQAECIQQGTWWAGPIPHPAGPRQGEVRIVTQVERAKCRFTGEARVWLSFTRYHPFRWDSRGFRKITPRADAAHRGACATLDELLKQPEVV